MVFITLKLIVIPESVIWTSPFVYKYSVNLKSLKKYFFLTICSILDPNCWSIVSLVAARPITIAITMVLVHITNLLNENACKQFFRATFFEPLNLKII